MNNKVSTHNRGFVAIEALAILIVVGILIGGYYVYSTSTRSVDIGSDTLDPQVSDVPSDEFVIPNNPAITPFTTQEDLETQTSDEDINALIIEVNSITSSINSLDEVSHDLELPEVDFSLTE